ncbi:HET-domain-containing protein [Corynespora cassiicola Philippines]|uniref:HET-domain-containing protein n=1 Tax=Corynespora cassiicola Philippines TaxID=1448308 RepID=A0A2T2NL06_CORCC|nr:HET-domain-containing protein [Corynespora cassiicola Philippines]
MSNETFCKACQMMFRGESKFDEAQLRFVHHVDAVSLALALLTKCPLCSKLWAGPKYSENHAEGLKSTTYIIQSDIEGPSPYVIDMSYEDPALIETQKIILYSFSELNDITKRLSDNTGTSSALDFLVTKYKQCHYNHLRCRSNLLGRGFIPKRVIDVGKDEDNVRLCQGNETDQGAKYATLSHCWGSSQPFKLTARTESQLRRGIPLSTLSRTFRDAIKVTRRLELQYLWIDSLCIFQDDLGDWASEARCMRDVYSHAACGLAATAAKDGSIGLFHKRDPTALMPLIVDAKCSRHSGLCFCFLPNGRYSIERMMGLTDNIDSSPLNKRAWVMQERYLSPRIAHFTRETLHWECHELFANELFPNGLPDWGLQNYRANRALKQLMNNFHRASTLDFSSEVTQRHYVTPSTAWKESLYEEWCSFRDAYSACQLTKGRDKLVALAGIVENVSEAMNSKFQTSFNGERSSLVSWNNKFLAGMWGAYFPRELCWMVYGDKELSPRVRPTKWRAPTWSWASTDCPVLRSHTTVKSYRQLYSWADIRQVVDVLDIQVDTKPSGELTRGFIRLKCRLLPVHSIKIETERLINMFIDENEELIPCSTQFDLYAPLIVKMDDLTLDYYGRSLDNLVLMIIQYALSEGGTITFVEGLVLMSPRTRSGAFKRVGSFIKFVHDKRERDFTMERLWARHKTACLQEIEIR